MYMWQHIQVYLAMYCTYVHMTMYPHAHACMHMHIAIYPCTHVLMCIGLFSEVPFWNSVENGILYRLDFISRNSAEFFTVQCRELSRNSV
jgi:hypothetical protein